MRRNWASLPAPAVAGDLVIFGGKAEDGWNFAHALDSEREKIIWKTQRVQAITRLPFLSVRTVIWIQAGSLLPINLADGTVLWRAGLGIPCIRAVVNKRHSDIAGMEGRTSRLE